MQSTLAQIIYVKQANTVYSSDSNVQVSCSNNLTASTLTINNNNDNNNNSLDEIKTQFFTPEGLYSQMTVSEYNRLSRLSLNQVFFLLDKLLFCNKFNLK